MKKTVQSLIVIALCAILASPALAENGRGRELVSSLGCKGCHQLEGSGGSLGPALDGVGARLSDEEIREKLVNPKADTPSSMMPSYERLSDQELGALVDFLGSLK